VFLCLCVFVSLCFCVCVFVSLCLCVFVSLCFCVCVFVSLCFCLCVFVSLCFCVFVFLSLCLCVFVSLCFCVVADQGKSRADRAQEVDPKAQVGGSDPRGVLPSAGATANWHMVVVTPAANQLMKDRDCGCVYYRTLYEGHCNTVTSVVHSVADESVSNGTLTLTTWRK